MISAFLIQQERRRGRRVLRQRDGAPEVGDDLVSAGLRPSSAETRSRGKTMEVCGRAAVRKSSQICPKSPIYIGGGRGDLALGSKGSPRGRPSQGGGLSPPKPSWTRFGGRESPFLPTSSLFFLFLLIFLLLAHWALVGCPTSPLRAGVTSTNTYGLPRSGLPPSGELPEPIRHSRYIPGNSENLPVIK